LAVSEVEAAEDTKRDKKTLGSDDLRSTASMLRTDSFIGAVSSTFSSLAAAWSQAGGFRVLSTHMGRSHFLRARRRIGPCSYCNVKKSGYEMVGKPRSALRDAEAAPTDLVPSIHIR
jgi:hypothetical protein